ncbi:MAG: cytochrome P450 [Acidimicrobiales bacterium]
MTVADAPAIDLLDPSSFAAGHPYEQYRWLRANDPVHWHAEPDGPGFWAVTRHEHVRTIGKDPHRFSSEPSIMIPDPDIALGIDGHQMMLMMDPPRHTRYRRLVNREFTPRSVEELGARVEELAVQIVDAVIERGECDLVEDLAGEMPSFVVADLLGLPLDDGRKLYRLTETVHAAAEAVPDGAQLGAILEMFNYGHELQAAKRGCPAHDLSSRLLDAEVEGHRLDEIDFNLFFMLLVDAGGDTTRNLVGAGMHALFERPDVLERLRADPERLLPGAIEELLRWVSPVVYMRRRATEPCELGGRAIAEGDKVVMYYGAANRDEDVFADADLLDIERSPNDHIAFGGGGPHFCLGSHLARIEIHALLSEILTRLVDLEPTGPPQWLASNFISGPKHLPVRFRPGPRA